MSEGDSDIGRERERGNSLSSIYTASAQNGEKNIIVIPKKSKM